MAAVATVSVEVQECTTQRLQRTHCPMLAHRRTFQLCVGGKTRGLLLPLPPPLLLMPILVRLPMLLQIARRLLPLSREATLTPACASIRKRMMRRSFPHDRRAKEPQRGSAQG